MPGSLPKLEKHFVLIRERYMMAFSAKRKSLSLAHQNMGETNFIILRWVLELSAE